MLYCSGKTGHWHSVGDYFDVLWAAAAVAHHYMSRGRTGAVTRKQKLIVFSMIILLIWTIPVLVFKAYCCEDDWAVDDLETASKYGWMDG